MENSMTREAIGHEKQPAVITGLLYLLVFTMPIGLTGIGLVPMTSSLGNISVSDFFLPVALLALLFFSFSYGKRTATKNGRVMNRFVFLAGLFLLIPILSLWNVIRYDGSLVTALFAVFKMAICVLYAFVFCYYLSKCNGREWKNFVIASTLAGVVFALSCFVGVALYYRGISNPFLESWKNAAVFRATGFQEDPNLAGIYLLLSIGYGLTWYRFARKKWKPVLSILVLVGGAFITASKAVMLTLALTFAAFVVLMLLTGRIKGALTVLGLSAVMLAVLLIVNHYTSILNTLIFRLTAAADGDITSALTGRDQIWTAAFTIIFANPLNFLVGVGPGMFGNATSYYQLTELTHGYNYVHNTLISFFVEFGILYAVGVLVLLLVGLIYLLRRLIREKENYALDFLWGYIAILIFMNSVTYQYNRMAYVFIVFTMVSLYRMKCGELKDPIPTVPCNRNVNEQKRFAERRALGKGMTDR